MKNAKKLFKHLLYVLLAITLISCDSDQKRRQTLSTKPNIMVDENGSYWIIQHHIGSLYTAQYLGDSTILKQN
jgi:hypothetical protein